MSGSDLNDSVSIPTQSQTLSLGSKKVSELIGSDVRVLSDGSVVGTLKYVPNYREFNETNVGEQSGNYFPLTLDAKYRNKPITVEKEDGTSKTATDTEWILRVKDKGSMFTFKDDQTEIVKLNFAKATLEGEHG